MKAITYHAIEIWKDDGVAGLQFRLYVPRTEIIEDILVFASPKGIPEELTKLSLSKAIELARFEHAKEHMGQLPIILCVAGEVVPIKNDNDAVTAILRFS